MSTIADLRRLSDDQLILGTQLGFYADDELGILARVLAERLAIATDTIAKLSPSPYPWPVDTDEGC
jgi:hypothetical protein